MFSFIRSILASFRGGRCSDCRLAVCHCDPPEQYWAARHAKVDPVDGSIPSAWHRIFDPGIDGCTACGTEDSGRFADRMDLCVDCDDAERFTHAASPVDEEELLPWVRAELDNRRPR